MVNFPIAVFYGGEIISTPQVGAGYTLLPRFTLEGNERTTFELVKSTIYQALGFEEWQYSIEM